MESPKDDLRYQGFAPGGAIYIACTDGGLMRKGQIWRYPPSPSPWGDLIVCEDGPGANGLVGVTPQGELYKLARNVLNHSELAAAVFSRDGTTLFVNIQRPGPTLAITGPWFKLRPSEFLLWLTVNRTHVAGQLRGEPFHRSQLLVCSVHSKPDSLLPLKRSVPVGVPLVREGFQQLADSMVSGRSRMACETEMHVHYVMLAQEIFRRALRFEPSARFCAISEDLEALNQAQGCGVSFAVLSDLRIRYHVELKKCLATMARDPMPTASGSATSELLPASLEQAE